MSDNPISAAQSRAARALLNWNQSELADAAKVGRQTIVDFERGARAPYTTSLIAIRVALEAAGIELIPENGGDAGVRLRRFRVGDLVELRSGSPVFRGLDINPGETGRVIQVEPHPPQTGPTYRMGVQFDRGVKVEGIFKFEFVLVKAVT